MADRLAAVGVLIAVLAATACKPSAEEPPREAQRRVVRPTGSGGVVYETGTDTRRVQIRSGDIAALVACTLNEQNRDPSDVRPEDVAQAMHALSDDTAELNDCRRRLRRSEKAGRPPRP